MAHEVHDQDRALKALRSVKDHVSAIEEAFRTQLNGHDGRSNPPTGLKILISVNLKRQPGSEEDDEAGYSNEPPRETRQSQHCWKQSVICGKGSSGYIYCEQTMWVVDEAPFPIP